MNRFLTLLLLGVMGFLSYKYIGFEATIVAILILIYWAMPVDTNQ